MRRKLLQRAKSQKSGLKRPVYARKYLRGKISRDQAAAETESPAAAPAVAAAAIRVRGITPV